MATFDIGTLQAIIQLQDRMTPALQLAGQRMKEVGTKMTRVGTQMRTVGTGMTAAITLPIAAIGTAAVKAALDFESSFAGVRKTVDATESEFAALEQGFRSLAKEIPVSVNEINRIGEAAGQLGIETENILGFTRVMADLGATTNLSADEAASALARLANITQLPQTDFDRLGSTIVALGNNLATTESEIVNFGLRIAGAGSQVGLTEAQILAFGGALSSVGIRAEAGGTAISRVFVEIANSVASGGEKLGQFAAIAGVSVDDFARSFQEDAAGATTTFIEGLGRLSDQGVNVFGVLEDVGFANIRVRDALLRASGAGDLLREALSLGSEAWEENTALAAEAQQRYDTMASKLTILWNIVRDVAVTFGTALLPTIEQLTDFLRTRALPVVERLATWFAELPQPVRTAAIVIAGLAAAAGPLLVVFGLMATSIGALLPLFATGSVGIGLLTTGLGALATGFAVAINPITLLAAAVLTATGTWDEFFRIVKAVARILVNIVVGAFRAVRTMVGFVIDRISDFIKTLDRGLNISDAFRAVMGFVADKLEKVAGVTTLADKGFFNLGSTVKSTGDAAEDATNQAIGLAADMQQLELVFDNFNRTGRITTESMRLIADKALELKAGGEVLSPVMRTLIDQLSSMAQAAVEVARAEKGTIDRTAKFTEALQDLGFIGLDTVNEKLATLADMEAAAAAMGVPAVAIAQALKAEYDALAEAADRSGLEVAALNEAITVNAVAGLQAIPVTQLSTHLWGLARHEIVGLTDEQNAAATQARLTAEAFERTGIATQASLMAARVQAETDYQLIAAAAGESSQQAQAAFQLLREKHDAEMGTLPGFWETTVIPGIAQTFTTLDTAIQGTFAQMILHTTSFKDGFIDIWDNIKSAFMNVLNQMVAGFLKQFLGKIIGSLTGSKNSIGKAIGDLFGGGGDKGGGIGGSILNKVLGRGGAVAAGTAAAGALLPSTALALSGPLSGLGAGLVGSGAAAAAGGSGLATASTGGFLAGGLGAGLATAGIGLGIAAIIKFRKAIGRGFKKVGSFFKGLFGFGGGPPKPDPVLVAMQDAIQAVMSQGGVEGVGPASVINAVNKTIDLMRGPQDAIHALTAAIPAFADLTKHQASFTAPELSAWTDLMTRWEKVAAAGREFRAGFEPITDPFGNPIEEEFQARHGLVGDFGSGTSVRLHDREAIVPLDSPSTGRSVLVDLMADALRQITGTMQGRERGGDINILIADGKARILGRAEFRQIAAAFQGAQIRVPSRGVGDRIG